MAALISDTFSGEPARYTPIREAPEPQLRALALAGSVDAAQELIRRRQEAENG